MCGYTCVYSYTCTCVDMHVRAKVNIKEPSIDISTMGVLGMVLLASPPNTHFQ